MTDTLVLPAFPMPGDRLHDRTVIASVWGRDGWVRGDWDKCRRCGATPIRCDDNGAGSIIWCHDHGSTVCFDVPAGSIADGKTAAPLSPEFLVTVLFLNAESPYYTVAQLAAELGDETWSIDATADYPNINPAVIDGYAQMGGDY